MSKVDELKQKYPQVSNATFTKFLNADTTPTLKYLDFMLKTWEDRKTNAMYRTTGTIIDSVKKFHELLPYIVNKDIYSKDYYGNYQNLVSVIYKAVETKDEKTFVREEHANVLMETDSFLFIQPTTHKGSMKYGANTKWCTTSKRDPGVFTRYSKNGLLVYLLDKTETITNPNYKKVAFYHEYANGGLNDSITLYNSNDNSVTASQVISGGWKEEVLFEIFMSYRYYFGKTKESKRTRDYIDSFVSMLERLDFAKFEEQILKLDEETNVSYISKAKDRVQDFLESLNKTKYGCVRKTEN
jgi:hypothetical protein